MVRFLFICSSFLIIISICGCKSSTSPSSLSSNASGTLVFEEGLDSVATASLGSNAMTPRFQGQDPAWTSDGRIVFALRSEFTPDAKERLNIANADGSNERTIVNLQESLVPIFAHPKLSRDGKYLSFNYLDYSGNKLGTNYGTLIYDATSGQQVCSIDSLWDAAWSSDGSLVVAGTVIDNDFSGVTTTFAGPGLFLVDKNFTSATPIGSGLTEPMLPSVSPNGKRIAFEMGNHIWTINRDGTGLTQITTGSNQESYSAWSPDGNSIACVTDGDLGGYIAIVSANPTGATTLSDQTTSLYVRNNAVYSGFVVPSGGIDWR